MRRLGSITGAISSAAALLLHANVLFCAEQIEFSASPGSRLVLSGKRQTVPLRVSLKGYALDQAQGRAPVNVAIVLDRSGSMSGEKLARAKEAAIMAIERLRPDDIISLVTYDDVIEVVVPATKVSGKRQIIDAIRAVEARGSTALFAGVSRGAAEVQKFMTRNRVNRVVLLSDGLANVGPSSPDELGSLGASLGKQGIPVSTIGLGLGYNEDLMVRLAGRSDGNHVFVENSSDLAQAFQREFGGILNAVARDIEVKITCPEAVRPVRVIGREAYIHGQTVDLLLSQLYAGQEKYIVLEIELPAGKAGEVIEVATAEISYVNLKSQNKEKYSRPAAVAFTDSPAAVNSSVDPRTLEAYYTQLTIDSNSRALALRDTGRKTEAQALLRLNASKLNERADLYNIPALTSLADNFEQQARDMDTVDWKRQRKGLSEYNYQMQTQN